MRLGICLALLLACTSTAALAQVQGDPTEGAQVPAQVKPPAPPLATARITGTVLCSDTHRPARGAIVMAQPISKQGAVQPGSGMMAARVGMDGTYTVEHLRAGDYTIIALLPGYLSPFDDFQLDEMMGDGAPKMLERLARDGIISVRDGETARMDVTLDRGASVAGHVFYSDGSPASQVLLDIEDVNAKPSAHKDSDPKADVPDMNAGTFIRSMFLHQSQGTDDQGRFRIAGLKPGTYRVAALQPTENPLNDIDGAFLFGIPVNQKALHIYSGDTLHKNSAKTYTLRSGDDVTGIDITIPVDAFHQVQGHLLTSDGRPIAVGALALTDTTDNSFVMQTTLERDGSFSFLSVPSGTYTLSATHAQVGTIPDSIPDSTPLQPEMLKDAHPFSDGSTTVLVKNSDVIDVILQLANPAAPAPSQ